MLGMSELHRTNKTDIVLVKQVLFVLLTVKVTCRKTSIPGQTEKRVRYLGRPKKNAMPL